MSTINIAWLAGLLEGEGTFIYRSGLRFTIASTDEDVITKASQICSSIYNGPYQYGNHKKPYWVLTVYGDKAASILEDILPFMGKRRTEKILLLLEKWKNRKKKRHFAVCHPTKRHHARGFCSTCYMKNRRSKECQR